MAFEKGGFDLDVKFIGFDSDLDLRKKLDLDLIWICKDGGFAHH